MPTLIPVQYSGMSYPAGIKPIIQEVAGHFDVSRLKISGEIPYSIHTEYSYGKRKFDGSIVKELDAIKEASKNGIPQLWRNKLWAKNFATFINELIGDSEPPAVIEIHPPFSDYSDIPVFLENYAVFEEEMKKTCTKITFLVENRSGSMYTGGKFILSDIFQIKIFHEALRKTELSLGITLDFPQLFTAHKIQYDAFDRALFADLFYQLKECRESIHGIHLWGKKRSQSGRIVPHCGDLNTLFYDKITNKMLFLRLLHDMLDDDIDRFFVPEVNSCQSDLDSIITDLLQADFSFIQ